MAQELEGEIRFGLGSTLAFHKATLKEIGGFEALADYLADDYELGVRIAKSGKKVKLADTVVETFLPRYSLRDFVRHQLRWARGIRDSRPGGYFGLGVTYAIPWALLTAICFPGAWWTWALLAVAVTARLSAAFTIGESILADQQVRKLWWMIPIRDCVALALWAAAFAGRTVYWRGDRFEVRNGKLSRIGD
jgi:ceramide glucosyltransferase